MLVHDLLLPADDHLPNIVEMMRRVIEYNAQKQSLVDGAAPIFNCFIAPDGALKFEALVMPAAVRMELTALLRVHEDEMHAFTDALMAVAAGAAGGM